MNKDNDQNDPQLVVILKESNEEVRPYSPLENLGSIRTLKAVSEMNRAISLRLRDMKLAEVYHSKEWRSIKGCKNFEDYCVLAGLQKSQAYEIRAGVDRLGLDIYKALKNLGLSTQFIARTRALPAETREILNEKVRLNGASKQEIVLFVDALEEERLNIEKDLALAEKKVTELKKQIKDAKKQETKTANEPSDLSEFDLDVTRITKAIGELITKNYEVDETSLVNAARNVGNSLREFRDQIDVYLEQLRVHGHKLIVIGASKEE